MDSDPIELLSNDLLLPLQALLKSFLATYKVCKVENVESQNFILKDVVSNKTTRF